MLSKDIEKRYQKMEQVLSAFEQVMQRLHRSGTRTVVAGEDLVRTKMATMVRPTTSQTPTVVSSNATQPAGAIVPASSAAAAAPPSLAAKFTNYKVPIAIAVVVLTILAVASSFWKSRSSAATASLAAPADVQPAANALPVAPAHPNEPVAPGVIATSDELSQPWASKEFVFHDELTSQFVPAMVVRLPRGGYWAFSLIEPYGTCRLAFVTDLQKLASDYGYPANHPLVVDPCNKTLFDLLRYGGPMDAEVRGDIVRGASVRPPIAIEVEEKGNSILAVKMEQD